MFASITQNLSLQAKKMSRKWHFERDEDINEKLIKTKLSKFLGVKASNLHLYSMLSFYVLVSLMHICRVWGGASVVVILKNEGEQG